MSSELLLAMNSSFEFTNVKGSKYPDFRIGKYEISRVETSSLGEAKSRLNRSYIGEEINTIIERNKIIRITERDIVRLLWRTESELSREAGGNAVTARNIIRQRLGEIYGLGIRQITPIHFTNNAFGGCAVYNRFFDVVNYHVTSDHYEVTDGRISGVQYRMELDGIADGLPGCKIFDTVSDTSIQYLFHKLRLEPTSKVEIQYDDSKLVKVSKHADEDNIFPPPLSILYVSIHTYSGQFNLEDPVIKIKSTYEDTADDSQNVEIVFNSNQEEHTLSGFCDYVQTKDPDIIIWTADYYANIVLDYLFARSMKLGLELQLGREGLETESLNVLKHPGSHWIKGRLSISNRTANRFSSVLDRFGFAGLIELCRFGFITLDLAAKYGMNRLIDSRNCYELIQRGFVIPENETNHHEHIRTVEELVSGDRGGMIISPQTGLHENAMVLDYDNQYANLISQSYRLACTLQS
jgi:hypothetical protein